ncbi:MAG: phage terminase large subunit family protein [Chitinophagales bacterium]|nr:phage terminase large subunit family protein [Chitinophagales bacterium]
MEDLDIFKNFKQKLLHIDPVTFCETYLKLEGKPFKLSGYGYKPFVDIYRYIGIKALEKSSKPIVLVKGRQVGGTTMALALEMYFVACGLFGNEKNPPIRILHAFPTLEHATRYTKGKMDPMIKDSVFSDKQKKGKLISYIESMLDSTATTNNSLSFKRFLNGNLIWIESTGVDGGRIRGMTADIIFFDECFPYNQCIATEDGKIPIGKLYNLYTQNKKLPKVLSFNEHTKKFEYKNIKKAWKRDKRELVELVCENRKIKCTPNHRFLTLSGWKKVEDMSEGEAIMTTNSNSCQISYHLNEDQFQVVLGSFLGDGHLQKIGKNKFRLKIIHGIKQKEYCSWKANLFKVNAKVVKNNGFSKKDAVKFCTKTFYLNEDLPKIKNHCPQWVLDKLDLRGLAIWFMDDGSRNNKNTFVFSTCGFDEDSQIRIVKKLKDFGINAEYRLYGKYYYIYLRTKEYEKLSNLVEPYINDNLNYKLYLNNGALKYIWNNNYSEYGISIVKSISYTKENNYVYDLEIEDNHNFIATSSKKSKGSDGLIAHNCQDTPVEALTNAAKILTASNYGTSGQGVQVYFGTPKKKGSGFNNLWTQSNQQYFHLGCVKCGEYFPLYTPESEEWESIWIKDFTVRCTHCKYEQNKLDAAEKGKWIETRPLEECSYIGFHINQLFSPQISKEFIIAQKPENHAMNTERLYRNEVLGEFFHGDSSPITVQEIMEKCGDMNRSMAERILPSENKLVFMGIDYGARNDLEQSANPEKKIQGQSYTIAVIISVENAGLIKIEFAKKFKKNDPVSKKETIEQLVRQFSTNLIVGDIGFSYDFSQEMAAKYGDKYLASMVSGQINNASKVKYQKDFNPKQLSFEKNFYISEIFEKMKAGKIRFPYKDYERIAWLIEHCASMEIKPKISRTGEHSINYVKGSIPNDGLMALLNAYLAYKFYISNGFEDQNSYNGEKNFSSKNQIPAILGIINKRF